MPSVRGVRTATAYVVWSLCVLAALFVAGAALLIALRVDPEHAFWGRWVTVADAVLVGWFDRSEVVSPSAGTEFSRLLRWGSAAGGLLLFGARFQWTVRPRGR